MKRVNLKQEFHGEPDMAQEGIEVAGQGPDEVTVEIVRGTLTLRVPSELPDDRVLDDENLARFLELVLELEDGSELTVILEEDREGVEVTRRTREEIAKEPHPHEG